MAHTALRTWALEDDCCTFSSSRCLVSTAASLLKFVPLLMMAVRSSCHMT